MRFNAAIMFTKTRGAASLVLLLATLACADDTRWDSLLAGLDTPSAQTTKGIVDAAVGKLMKVGKSTKKPNAGQQQNNKTAPAVAAANKTATAAVGAGSSHVATAVPDLGAKAFPFAAVPSDHRLPKTMPPASIPERGRPQTNSFIAACFNFVHAAAAKVYPKHIEQLSDLVRPLCRLSSPKACDEATSTLQFLLKRKANERAHAVVMSHYDGDQYEPKSYGEWCANVARETQNETASGLLRGDPNLAAGNSSTSDLETKNAVRALRGAGKAATKQEKAKKEAEEKGRNQIWKAFGAGAANDDWANADPPSVSKEPVAKTPEEHKIQAAADEMRRAAQSLRVKRAIQKAEKVASMKPGDGKSHKVEKKTTVVPRDKCACVHRNGKKVCHCPDA